jgi:hypothetical protein
MAKGSDAGPNRWSTSMHSTDPNADLELLAALIDGRLSGEERARAVKLLAESDESLEVFANVVRDQRAEGAKVIPMRPSRRWNQWKIYVPVAAAAAVAIIMIPRLVNRLGTESLAARYAMELTDAPHFSDALREGWTERGWSVTRGVGREAPGTPLAVEPKYVFRLGVRSVDLQVSLRRGDTALAARLTNEMIATLSNVQMAEDVSLGYDELKTRISTDGIDRSIERASSLEEDLRERVGNPSLFAFGQWTSAAELAARTRDTSFFESERGIRYIQSAMPAGTLTKDDADALRSIDSLVTQGLDDRSFDDVQAKLQAVIRNRGS